MLKKNFPPSKSKASKDHFQYKGVSHKKLKKNLETFQVLDESCDYNVVTTLLVQYDVTTSLVKYLVTIMLEKVYVT